MVKENWSFVVLSILVTILFLAGCTLGIDPMNSGLPPTSTDSPIPTNTEMPSPTPTEAVDYVALVNGEGIRQTSFDASLLQFQQALQEYPELLAPDQTAEERVLVELVNRVLLSQAARAAGFNADQQMVADRLAKLIEQAGSEQAFDDWLQENGYTLESFTLELPWEIEAAWQRSQITSTVPQQVEQVRARQVLFYDPFQAQRAYDQLEAGIAFETIIENNDPKNLGYLDWFPRGLLIFPELEDVAFSLEPGQYSGIIETIIGYHILYVMEKDPAHPLSTEARLTLEEQALADWLAQQRSQSQIDTDLP